VVLSEGGNQAAEMAGGADIMVTPAKPLRMAQKCADAKNHPDRVAKVLKTQPETAKEIKLKSFHR